MRRIFFWLLWGVFLLTSCVSLREAESAAEPERKSEVRPAEAAVNWGGNLTPAVPDAENEPAEPVELDDPYADVDVTFLGVGDLLVHPNIYMDAGFRGYEGKTYDFLPMFSDVADFFAEADIAFVNQETVMAGEKYGYSGYPCFNAPQQLGMDLCTLGVDIVNIANNHMLDMGTAGLADTIAFWKTQPTLMVGAYDDEEDAATLRILERDGITIAVLAYTFGTNGLV
ncbi:MAG: CapA family protein, partial [Eubacteriales bacterium]